jgi:RimJ/RimL family protein N-acetyltransferase
MTPPSGSPWVGARVRLRAPEPSDADAFLSADDDGDGARSGWRVFPPRSRWATEEWLRQSAGDGDEFRVVVESLAADEAVGTLNTYGCDPVAGTFSYGVTIWPWHRRCGYASDAVVVTLRYLFGERRYQKCTVGVLAFNEASVALHRSLGFAEEGRIRRAHFRAGQHWDELVFGLTVDEFAVRWGFSPLS